MTELLPKALMPVLGTPFADWQLRHLAAQGVERVVYSIGYRGDMLRQYVADGAQYRLAVTWVDEGTWLRGTGGAVRLALDRGALDEAFFVMYGDSYLLADLRLIEQAWRSSGLPALMTVIRNENRWDLSNAIYEDRRVTHYDKSRPLASRTQMRWIDYGLLVLTRDVVADGFPPGAVGDLADLMRQVSLNGQLAGLEIIERFYEAGSPQGVRDLEEYLSSNQSL